MAPQLAIYRNTFLHVRTWVRRSRLFEACLVLGRIMEVYPGRRTMIPPMSPDTLVGGCMDHTRCFKPWGPRCEAVVSVVSRHCVVVKQRGIEHEVARLQILPDDRLLYLANSISSSFSDFHRTSLTPWLAQWHLDPRRGTMVAEPWNLVLPNSCKPACRCSRRRARLRYVPLSLV